MGLRIGSRKSQAYFYIKYKKMRIIGHLSDPIPSSSLLEKCCTTHCRSIFEITIALQPANENEIPRAIRTQRDKTSEDTRGDHAPTDTLPFQDSKRLAIGKLFSASFLNHTSPKQYIHMTPSSTSSSDVGNRWLIMAVDDQMVCP